MEQQISQQVAEQQGVAGIADQQVASPPQTQDAAPAGAEQNWQELYKQAMDDNAVLAQNLNQTQAFAQQIAQQVQAEQAKAALGQLSAQEQHFLDSIQDMPPEQQKAEIRRYYGAQTAQIMQMAQQFVQQTAAEKYRDDIAARYQLSEEDRHILSGTHPSQMEVVAYNLANKNRQFAEIHQKVQQLTAAQVAAQMQASGAYAGGAGGQNPSGAGAPPAQYEPGKRSHLQFLLRNPQQ